jgi:hypothetical protein
MDAIYCQSDQPGQELVGSFFLAAELGKFPLELESLSIDASYEHPVQWK